MEERTIISQADEGAVIKENLRKSVSDDINNAMYEKGVSKADLARTMGTSRSNITQILKGDRNFTIDTLCDIAHAIGMSVKISFKNEHGSRRKKD
ncbi:MAG: helix-turn-helix transcriptional regulator [Sphaerochaetaceae bacterium]|nr:helix-turn-helix transcriptional regulator [Sphaerochaetaceae bacterium]MDD3162821.1 helix-turn-helix transcriptional regulator [Sphaerochaetaceae bacterium]MDD4006856.1 helix-turn-helix transcriptional regulator [Sphaerochaetaceae bacterium]MDD4395986.1 helix-turn-helix transcriptional regulator [Sphaerochaetaceae bacterium]